MGRAGIPIIRSAGVEMERPISGLIPVAAFEEKRLLLKLPPELEREVTNIDFNLPDPLGHPHIPWVCTAIDPAQPRHSPKGDRGRRT